MKKYLITGFSGFVAKHFIDYFSNRNDISILGIDIKTSNYNQVKMNSKCQIKQLDLLNKEELKNIVKAFRPDYIIHLASYSSVAFSWDNPVKSFLNNTNIFLNILEVVRETDLKCRVLSVGSSEEYGNVEHDDIPLKETHLLKPVSPYAVARVSQELLSKIYVDGYGLDVVMTRSFNHIGIYQEDKFIMPSLIKQLLKCKKENKSVAELIVGNVNVIRDFLDVRDVVCAYDLLLKKGISGEIYNICSNKGYTISEIIRILGRMIDIKIKLKVSEKLIRPRENNIVIGCNEKLCEALDWYPKFTLEQSLKEMIAYYQ